MTHDRAAIAPSPVVSETGQAVFEAIRATPNGPVEAGAPRT